MKEYSRASQKQGLLLNIIARAYIVLVMYCCCEETPWPNLKENVLLRACL